MQIHKIPGWRPERNGAELHHIYLAMAASPDGRQLVKVGMALDPLKRIKEVQVGCPFRITSFSFSPVGSRLATRDVESLIHRVFSPCHSSGEWFAFDLSNAEHKKIWRGGVSAVLNAKLGKGKWQLSYVDMAAYHEQAAETRSLAFAVYKAKKKVSRRRRIISVEEALAKSKAKRRKAIEHILNQ